MVGRGWSRLSIASDFPASPKCASPATNILKASNRPSAGALLTSFILFTYLYHLQYPSPIPLALWNIFHQPSIASLSYVFRSGYFATASLSPTKCLASVQPTCLNGPISDKRTDPAIHHRATREHLSCGIRCSIAS